MEKSLELKSGKDLMNQNLNIQNKSMIGGNKKCKPIWKIKLKVVDKNSQNSKQMKINEKENNKALKLESIQSLLSQQLNRLKLKDNIIKLEKMNDKKERHFSINRFNLSNDNSEIKLNSHYNLFQSKSYEKWKSLEIPKMADLKQKLIQKNNKEIFVPNDIINVSNSKMKECKIDKFSPSVDSNKYSTC